MEEAQQNLKAVQEAHRKDVVQMEERSWQHSNALDACISCIAPWFFGLQ